MSKPTITESDLSAFARLAEDLARSAIAGAEHILQTYRRDEDVSAAAYAAAALEFAESIAKTSGAVPPVFIDGYFSRRLLAGETPDYTIPESGLPNTGGETRIRPMYLA